MFEVIEKIFINEEKEIKKCTTFDEALKKLNSLSRNYKEKIDIKDTKDIDDDKTYKFMRFFYHKHITIILAIKELI